MDNVTNCLQMGSPHPPVTQRFYGHRVRYYGGKTTRVKIDFRVSTCVVGRSLQFVLELWPMKLGSLRILF